MESVAIAVNAFIVLVVGLVLGYLGKERFDALDRRIDEVRAEVREVRAEVREVRAEVREGDTQIRSEMAALRSDVTNIALAVGARQRPNTG